MKDETIILWHFDRLFRNVFPVSAKVNAPKSNPTLKRDFLEKIQMTEVRSSRLTPPGRNIFISFWWHNRTDKHGGSWGNSLSETLENTGATKLGCSPHDSFSVYWRLNRGEQFCDGAMRIAKILFEMLDIKIEKNPLVTDNVLISMFMVYKVSWVKTDKIGLLRFDDYLRLRHNLPRVPYNLGSQVL